MDKNRLIKIIELSLRTSFDENLNLVEFEMIPTQKFDNSTDKWIPDSYSFFMTIESNKEQNYDNYIQNDFKLRIEIEKFLEALLGCDCCVNFK